MLLSEERAEQLVDEWTRDFAIMTYERSPARWLEVWSEFAFDNVMASILYGEHLRRAMEGFNALAACSGFDPAENPSFWRRIFQKQLHVPDTTKYAIEFMTKEVFGKYTIRANLGYMRDPAAVAFAIDACTSPGAANRGARIRDEILALLEDYLAHAPGAINVDFHIILPHSGLGSKTSWWEFERMLKHLKSLCEIHNEATTTKLRMILGDRRSPIKLDESFGDGVNLLARSSSLMELSQLHVSLEKCAFKGNGIKDLGRLLQYLARQDSFQSLTMKLPRDDQYDAAMRMVFSALPHMSWLTWLGIVGMSPWLVYALRSPQQRGLLTSLEVSTARGGPDLSTGLRNALTRQHCLMDEVPEAIRMLMNPEFLPIGTSAIVREGTELKSCPFLDGDDIRVDQDWRLDVVARCGSRLLVILPGVGLRWVNDDAVVIRLDSQPVPDDAHPLGLEAVVFTDANMAEVSGLLALIGPRLLNLRLEGRDQELRLEELLHWCPHLTHLTLQGMHVASLLPLVDAFGRSECRISNFASNTRKRTQGLAELLTALCDPEHPLAKTMEVLSLEMTLPNDGFEEIICRLARNRRLRYLQAQVMNASQR